MSQNGAAIQQLFVFYVGGAVKGAHLELHDTRFVVGESAEACWPALKAQWWGEPTSLHLDAWGPLRWADGHRVDVVEGDADNGDLKLWFVHLGGYAPAQFTELHDNRFIVAPDARTAKMRALEQSGAKAGWVSPHKDALMAVDAAIDVAASAAPGGVSVKLTPDDSALPFEFEARYVPIGKL